MAQPVDERVARGGVGMHGDQVQPCDHVAAAPHGAGDLDPLHALELCQREPYAFELVARVMEQPEPSGLAQGGDPAADALRRL